MTAFPANPYFRSKSAEHDVTLTSFTADLSKLGRYNLHNLCKILQEGYIKFCDRASNGLGDMAKKKREGAMYSPPVGRRLRYTYLYRKRRSFMVESLH